MNTSALLGSAILFGALLILILFVKAKNDKEYKAAMAEYERKMAEYNEAVAALEKGGFAPKAAPAAAAAPAAVAAPAAAADPNAPTADEIAAATAAILAAEAEAAAAAAPAATVGEGVVKLNGVSEENAAMIMAILCDELGCSPADLVFHSITAL